MKVTIEIDTGNAAFGDTPYEVGCEIGRILARLSVRLNKHGAPGFDEVRLFDLNGNQVGTYRTTEWDHEGEHNA